MGSDLAKAPKDITCDDFKDASAFIDDLFEKENGTYCKTFIGSRLQGGNKEQVGHFFTGKGSNGKTKLENVVASSFGGYYCPVQIGVYTKLDEDTAAPKQYKLRMRGTRISWCNELTEKTKFNTANFHRECDNTSSEARGMYSKEMVRINPQYGNIISTNYNPQFTDEIKYATVRRIRVVPFKYNFKPVELLDKNNPYDKLIDPNLESKLLKQDMIEQFNMMWVYYFMEYKKTGLKPTKDMKQYTDDYIKSLDVVTLFLAESIEKCEGSRVWTNELHNDYERFCKSEGIEAMKKRQFIAKLKEGSFTVKQEKKRACGHKDEYYIDGFKVLDNSEEEDRDLLD
jgi:P4 family phage/plasmid primase-like protien